MITADREVPRSQLIAGQLLGTVVFFGLALVGWGDRQTFLSHPARLGVVIATVFLVVWSLRAPFNLSSGQREDERNRWIFLPMAVLVVLLAWLPAYTDRRDLLTLDGSAVRYVGLVLYVAGGILRIWPVFVLGRRFSGLVAIQENHELVTDGVYKLIRHPSYLGGYVNLLGWILVFRSAIGLLLLAATLGLGVARINAEEALLQSQFGEQYAAYRRRTWRLIPFLY